MPDPVPETAELKNLRAALDAARRQTDEANNRAVVAESRLRSETSGRFAAQEAQIENSITTTETSLDAMQAQQKTLFEEGKFDEASAMGRRMAEATATLIQLRGQKNWLVDQKQAAEAQANRPADPYAEWPAEQRRWIDQNPQFRNDPTFRNKALAAAQYATQFEGIAENSPQWFDYIERKVYPERFNEGGRQPNGGDGGDPQQAQIDPITDEPIQVEPGRPLEQQHTMPQNFVDPSPEAPPLRLEPNEPQQRAIGRGGTGVSSAAAAPSRRIGELGRPLQNRNVTLSPEEWEAAQAIVPSIEPMTREGDRERPKTPLEIAQTYYAWLHHPTNTNVGRNGPRRRSWAKDAIVA